MQFYTTLCHSTPLLISTYALPSYTLPPLLFNTALILFTTFLLLHTNFHNTFFNHAPFNRTTMVLATFGCLACHFVCHYTLLLCLTRQPCSCYLTLLYLTLPNFTISYLPKHITCHTTQSLTYPT